MQHLEKLWNDVDETKIGNISQVAAAMKLASETRDKCSKACNTIMVTRRKWHKLYDKLVKEGNDQKCTAIFSSHFHGDYYGAR